MECKNYIKKFQGAGIVEDRYLDSGPIVYLNVDRFRQLTTLTKYQ